MARYDVNFHNDARIAAAVDQPIPPELISRRSAGNNATFSYLRGDIDADKMNEIFGPLGWGAVASPPEITRFEDRRTVYRKVPNQKNKQPFEADMMIYVVTSQVTITIKKRTPESSDTIFTQTGVGYGEVEIGKHAKDAVAMAVKGAETDGFKRCTVKLGKAFGLFLTSNGSQDAIDYAHNNDANNRRNAHQIAQQRGDVDAASQGSGPKQQPKASQQQPDRRMTQAEQQGRTQQQGTPTPEPSEMAEAPIRTDEQGDRSAGTRQGRPQRPANENYNLDNEPITRDDQIDFAATIIARMRDAANPADRSGLLRRYIRTINALDVTIRKRLQDNLAGHDLDLDRIAA